MKILAQKTVPTHIISGFLGAGKTTLLQHLLSQKPKNEVWAVLMNEFGQIGVDQQLLPQDQGYAVKELLGGCLCCSSQLPMHIALARLLSEQKPDRLFIEPTGLGHPSQLFDQLTEPHWQNSLAMRALITVVDGSRLHDTNWVKQNLYEDQLKAAQIVVVSHADTMTFEDEQALVELKEEYQPYQQQWLKTEHGQLELAQIDVPARLTARSIQPLLEASKTNDRSWKLLKKFINCHITMLSRHKVILWRVGNYLNVGNLNFMLCSMCYVHRKTGYVLKEFLIQIRDGRPLTLILNSLTISLVKKGLIIVLK